MCEMPNCKLMWYMEDDGVKSINQDFATEYLYRIFVFDKGRGREHDLSVRAFQDFLHQKGINYSIRAIYDYAEGKVPFPAALLPHLIEFSKDPQLVSLFLLPIKTALKELNTHYETTEQQLKSQMAEIRKVKEELSL